MDSQSQHEPSSNDCPVCKGTMFAHPSNKGVPYGCIYKAADLLFLSVDNPQMMEALVNHIKGSDKEMQVDQCQIVRLVDKIRSLLQQFALQRAKRIWHVRRMLEARQISLEQSELPKDLTTARYYWHWFRPKLQLVLKLPHVHDQHWSRLDLVPSAGQVKHESWKFDRTAAVKAAVSRDEWLAWFSRKPQPSAPLLSQSQPQSRSSLNVQNATWRRQAAAERAATLAPVSQRASEVVSEQGQEAAQSLNTATVMGAPVVAPEAAAAAAAASAAASTALGVPFNLSASNAMPFSMMTPAIGYNPLGLGLGQGFGYPAMPQWNQAALFAQQMLAAATTQAAVLSMQQQQQPSVSNQLETHLSASQVNAGRVSGAPASAPADSSLERFPGRQAPRQSGGVLNRLGVPPPPPAAAPAPAAASAYSPGSPAEFYNQPPPPPGRPMTSGLSFERHQQRSLGSPGRYRERSRSPPRHFFQRQGRYLEAAGDRFRGRSSQAYSNRGQSRHSPSRASYVPPRWPLAGQPLQQQDDSYRRPEAAFTGQYSRGMCDDRRQQGGKQPKQRESSFGRRRPELRGPAPVPRRSTKQNPESSTKVSAVAKATATASVPPATAPAAQFAPAEVLQQPAASPSAVTAVAGAAAQELHTDEDATSQLVRQPSRRNKQAQAGDEDEEVLSDGCGGFIGDY